MEAEVERASSCDALGRCKYGDDAESKNEVTLLLSGSLAGINRRNK